MGELWPFPQTVSGPDGACSAGELGNGTLFAFALGWSVGWFCDALGGAPQRQRLHCSAGSASMAPYGALGHVGLCGLGTEKQLLIERLENVFLWCSFNSISVCSGERNLMWF